jgi:Lantibiotic dehydratase, N terminus
MTGDLRRSRVELDRGWRLWRQAAFRSAGLCFDKLSTLVPANGDVATATAAAIRGFVRDETFSSAVTWQHPDLVRNWYGAFARAAHEGSAAGAQQIRREAVVARYAQRYCAKNDTVGFFGPVAWATLGGDTTDHSGTGGIRRRSAYFEVWAIKAIADAWNKDPELTAHLPVRLDPACTVVGDEVRRPMRSPLRLDQPGRQLVAALANARSVASLVELSGLGDTEAQRALARLRADYVVQVGFRVPVDSNPEIQLARQVEAVADDAVRERLATALRPLGHLAAEAAAALEPGRLAGLLDDVERRLADAAGAPVHRPAASGGGRTPMYLDCRRDLDVRIGSDALADLHAPLSILLDSARWLAGQVGEAVEEALRTRYLALRARRHLVTLADLQIAAADLLVSGDGLVADVVADFQLRWADILPPGDADAVVPAGRARQLADALFPAAGRWWAAARTHSPDLLLRRTCDGRLSWVLGELHVAMNTLENRFFLTQADDAAGLVAAVAADSPEGRVVPVYPSISPEVAARTYPPLSLDPPDRYRYWSFSSDDGHRTGAATTAATALVVRERGDRLVATGGGWEAPVLECFGEFVSALTVNLFRPRSPRRYAPRVGIDGLTVCRRTWRIPLHELGAVRVRSADPAHTGLRDWSERQGLPRHAFVRTPRHPKPFYVDFAAPVLVDNLARAIRRVGQEPGDGAWLEVVEMLPSPDELWLTLAGDGRYTSELRTVAVDPVTGTPASWPVPSASTGRQREEVGG